MKNKKITKFLCIVLCAFFLISLGIWFLHIDKEREKMHEIKRTQPVKAVEQMEFFETNQEIALNVGDKKEKLELNTATKEELDELPGIGPALAERIIEHRSKTPFKIVRDIKKVPGIGHKKYLKICEFVYVEGE